MRPVSCVFLTAWLLVGPVAGVAQAVTVRDLIALSQAGLGDDVLVALIDSDGSVFSLTPLEVLDLRRQGLSDRVLVKMIETAKLRPTVPGAVPRDVTSVVQPLEPTQLPPQPQIVVHQTVVQKVVQQIEAPRSQPRYVQVLVYVPVAVPQRPVKAPEPVYWGWGGQRRPDSWQEPGKKAGGKIDRERQ